jgi:hypothetical protein
VRGFSIPIDQICRLLAAKLERDANVVQERGHEDVAFRRRGGLVLRPFGLDRVFRPEHNHASGRFELSLDGLIECLAGNDAAVPPDGPAAGLERARQAPGTVEIFPGVADEDVRHGAYPSGRAESTASTCPRASRRSLQDNPFRDRAGDDRPDRKRRIAAHLRGHEGIAVEDDLEDL